MVKQLDRARKGESDEKPTGRPGAKEILTQDLARRIGLMIKQFPNANIPVTWDNIARQVKLRFGHEFRRNVLSQKAWGDRKLIAEAFQDAKKIQRRLARDTAPKYANEPRSRLRQIVAKLQGENLALREQLDQVRAQQYDEIHSLLDTRTPLSRLGATRSELGRETVTSVGEVKARRSRKAANNGMGNSAPGK
ncbi:hypothetical protein [Paraburkholderia sp. MM5384-R2]|uniref:hypothetical protein n=1 Tax=Paraburkholderia sp. MM5384-R2 TaxID=2723097 RepID=UPI00160A8532|nr:hypothetical protein [Paraburkholderia sp. MM5384-R2]MBB5503159.1 hypothetical protein [Paraburkholderia sp. MM5384-R2]